MLQKVKHGMQQAHARPEGRLADDGPARSCAAIVSRLEMSSCVSKLEVSRCMSSIEMSRSASMTGQIVLDLYASQGVVMLMSRYLACERWYI